MDFKSILQSFSTLAEGETKDTKTGRVHKGDYGTKYDGDDDKKEKKPEVKRGRGRPKKDAGEDGEVKKYDTKGLHDVFGGGKKPKKEVGKTSKKHSLKEYMEEVETSKVQLDEAEQVQIVPAQSNTQIIKQGTKTLGTVTNPQLAQQIKQSIGRGEMSLAGNELGEGEMDESALQAYLGNKKYGKEGMDALRKAGREGASKQKMAMIRAKYNKMDEEALDQPGTMEGAPEVLRKHGGPIEEKAPPGAKAERMVKHIKAGYAKDGKLSPKEKSIAYATAWKAHNKGKVEESMQINEGAIKHLIDDLIADIDSAGFRSAFNIKGHTPERAERQILAAVQHDPKYSALSDADQRSLVKLVLDFYRDEGELEEGILDSTTKTLPFGAKPDPLTIPPTKRAPFKTLDNVKAAIRANKMSDPQTMKTIRTEAPMAFEGNEMKDIQLESWEQQLNSLLTEGITVTSSTGQQGAPDSVSINATDADAQELLAIVRQAGLGVFGSGEEKHSDYGAPMSDTEPEGHGVEPEMSPAVVGDGDDMLSLIKKMTGIDSAPPAATADYEDEEGEESDEHDDDSEEEKTDEGNKFTGNLAKARAAGKKEADLDGDGDMEKVHEGDESCNECGMYEAECKCDEEQVEENFANDAGGDAMADTELAKLKALLSMGNDLHKMKRDQTVLNPTQVTVRESIDEWKKLSGIK